MQASGQKNRGQENGFVAGGNLFSCRAFSCPRVLMAATCSLRFFTNSVHRIASELEVL
jgi:hypothetical protein